MSLRELTLDELDCVTGGTGKPDDCTPKDKNPCHPGNGWGPGGNPKKDDCDPKPVCCEQECK